MATSCAPALAPERLIDTTPMDPALLGENLRRNRLERTRSRQAEIRRGKLRETPGAAAKDEQGQGTTDETAALETTAVAAADSWSLEFAARQVQRRATQRARRRDKAAETQRQREAALATAAVQEAEAEAEAEVALVANARPALCARAAWALGTYAVQLERDLSLATPLAVRSGLSCQPDAVKRAVAARPQPEQELRRKDTAGPESEFPLLRRRPMNTRRYTGRREESCASSRTESMLRMRPSCSG